MYTAHFNFFDAEKNHVHHQVVSIDERNPLKISFEYAGATTSKYTTLTYYKGEKEYCRMSKIDNCNSIDVQTGDRVTISCNKYFDSGWATGSLPAILALKDTVSFEFKPGKEVDMEPGELFQIRYGFFKRMWMKLTGQPTVTYKVTEVQK